MLKADGVKVFAVSPGFLATGLSKMPNSKEVMKNYGATDASIGGRLLKEIVEGQKDSDAGKVVGQDGVQPW